MIMVSMALVMTVVTTNLYSRHNLASVTKTGLRSYKILGLLFYPHKFVKGKFEDFNFSGALAIICNFCKLRTSLGKANPGGQSNVELPEANESGDRRDSLPFVPPNSRKPQGPTISFVPEATFKEDDCLAQEERNRQAEIKTSLAKPRKITISTGKSDEAVTWEDVAARCDSLFHLIYLIFTILLFCLLWYRLSSTETAIFT